MTTQNVVSNTGNAAIIQLSNPKVFLWNRRSLEGLVNNPGSSDLVIPEGTVMGRISGSGLLKPVTSGASDGSQLIVGVLVDGAVIPAGQTKTVFVCDDGDVNEGQLIFQSPDTIETVVASRRFRDWLKVFGIKPIKSDEMTKPDNQ